MNIIRMLSMKLTRMLFMNIIDQLSTSTSSQSFIKNTFTRSTFQLSMNNKRRSSMRSMFPWSMRLTRRELLRKEEVPLLPNQEHNQLLQQKLPDQLSNKKFWKLGILAPLD